tara:strand:- start:860 stop:1033 length:174 start_codon:yes stop_codon:yes gene_type:complete
MKCLNQDLFTRQEAKTITFYLESAIQGETLTDQEEQELKTIFDKLETIKPINQELSK